MLPSSSLRYDKPFPAARARMRTPLRPRPGSRPQAEALEDRRLLSTYTAGSVRDLIARIHSANNAGGSHTILLPAGVTFDLKRADNTTHGASGLPVIGAAKAVDLTIVGNGDTIRRVGGYTFNRKGVAVNPFRLFNVAPGASLTLDRVTLEGGWVYDSVGGAIYNQGTLMLSNGSRLSGNVAGAGGGVFNQGGALTVIDSALDRNSALGSGGGIYNAGGTVTLGNGALHGNSSHYGGGVFNNAGTLAVSHSNLSGNSARFGGGVYNLRGSVSVSNNSTLSGNWAFHADYPWAGGDGGAIYNSGGTVSISSSILSGNSADPFFGTGGGIYNDSDGTVTVAAASSIAGNTSRDVGGDVDNRGVLYLDGASTIGSLYGNAAVRI